jgi:hypothetical protein
MRLRLAALFTACALWAGAVQAQAPADQQLARQAVEQILGAWNTAELNQWLAPEFPDRDRLLAALSFDVPPTARLRILSIGAVQLLEQERTDKGLVSLVSVTVRAQAEWEDAENGLQRRVGTSEYILRLIRTVPR